MNRELGRTVVAAAATADDATISDVNYAEVLQKARRKGVAPEIVAGLLALSITVTPFGRLDARRAASFNRHGPASAWPTASARRWRRACPVPPSRRTGLGWTELSPSTSASSRSADRAPVRVVSVWPTRRALQRHAGTEQPEALAVYRRAGYEAVECYGYFAADPTTICFHKRLALAPADEH
ncbi:type II toxin-antitoxin system VapC family toxin [Streptomyces sp. NP160]|uniref:type II toxin-antitoxin system VapC family toxin n=1 Tax=Streptomyces sp. NP160 TaxID=2586637 RepID=UPI001119C3CA|nr:type II toxin-antitoxin system VapC family toxin [Streptomyces sp. NP160]TNM59627.1 type II toxin-antitoxin system VapC family toxin [Streptomyces sp. NP160]